MKSLLCLPILVLVSFALAGCGGGSGEKNGEKNGEKGGTTVKLTIATAPSTGAFAPVGAGIANAVNAATNINLKVSTRGTKGTMENIRLLDAGRVQFGMANSAISYFSAKGEDGWDKPYPLKSVVTIAPNISQFVALKSSGVKTIADFKGKRVVVGPAGAGFEYFIKPILEAHGVSYDDFQDLNAKPGEAGNMLKNGDADVAFLGGAVPMPAVSAVAAQKEVIFVPFDPAAVAKLQAEYPFFQSKTIAADKYEFLAADFQAISCGDMQLITTDSVAEDTVYQFTKAMYNNRAEVVKSHPAGKAINPKNAARHVGLDFHPGALKFYKEAGLSGQ